MPQSGQQIDTQSSKLVVFLLVIPAVQLARDGVKVCSISIRKKATGTSSSCRTALGYASQSRNKNARHRRGCLKSMASLSAAWLGAPIKLKVRG